MSKNTGVSAFESPTIDEDSIVNTSGNAFFEDIFNARMDRRGVLRGGIAATAGALLGTMGLTACGGGGDAVAQPVEALKLGFGPVVKNLNDVVTVPEGYQASVIYALGDPLVYGIASWKGDGSETADSYNLRAGDGHDGMYYFGLSESGAFQQDRSDRGLLVMNHEYVVAPFAMHPSGATKDVNGNRPAAEVDKEVNAHGVSVVEIRREANGAVATVRGSRFNRRITSTTPMEITGPGRGSALMVTKYSPNGTATRGTNNNCANGYTPWGTYLTCEENFIYVWARAGGDDANRTAREVTALNRYDRKQNAKSRYGWETAGSGDLYVRWNASVTGATAVDDYRNALNTYGWVVEIDPFNPDAVPAKRTALGRFSHEGAWPASAVAGKPIVIYMGDDARNENIYKFVSKANWDPADVGKGMAAGAKYLDEGTLYVAKFNDDGTGQWLELTYGKNGLDGGNAAYPFADQADVVTHARLAADKLGATKMDRPEWGAVNPLNGEVYMTLTNNSQRGTSAATDAANPRSYVDTYGGGAKTNKGNVHGHIIRWREEDGNTAATGFNWDIYLFGAEADAPADVNLSGLTAVNDFSSPDGLYFDKRGMLWIQTDDGAYTDVTNCMMLAAIPGKVGDGGEVTAVGGTKTLRGANVSADTVRRFLVGPKECEITGITLTPDYRTMFINVQHPGEDAPADFAANIYGSNWPASQTDSAAKSRPRSATVVIWRKDGGVIGA